jgi:hypothetical protein
LIDKITPFMAAIYGLEGPKSVRSAMSMGRLQGEG